MTHNNNESPTTKMTTLFEPTTRNVGLKEETRTGPCPPASGMCFFLSFFLSLLHNWQRGLFLRTTTLTTEEVMATSDWLGRQTLTTNREKWRSCRNRGTGLEPKRVSSPSSRFSFFFLTKNYQNPHSYCPTITLTHPTTQNSNLER